MWLVSGALHILQVRRCPVFIRPRSTVSDRRWASRYFGRQQGTPARPVVVCLLGLGCVAAKLARLSTETRNRRVFLYPNIVWYSENKNRKHRPTLSASVSVAWVSLPHGEWGSGLGSPGVVQDKEGYGQDPGNKVCCVWSKRKTLSARRPYHLTTSRQGTFHCVQKAGP